jgi:uncharacterized protein (DUF433 family)
MWTTYEHWQLIQLRRLSKIDPERVETMLNTLWNSYPGLLTDLSIAAVDQEQLSVDACAKLLNIPTSEVDQRLLEFRNRSVQKDCDWAVVVDEGSCAKLADSRIEDCDWAVVVDEGSCAKLADSRIAVWEIVREYRKLGSVERLTEAFPSLPKSELAAALVYAEQNPGEIESQISRYEEMLQKKRAEYPFMR